MSGPAPPAGRQQTAARVRLDVGEVRHLGIVGVGAEGVLLAVARAEDVVAGQLYGGNHHEVEGAEHDRVYAQVAGLQAIDERDPRQVSEGKHEAEAVGGDVHGGEDGGLHPQRVEHVPRLREGHDQHGVGDIAVGSILLGHEGQVQYDPAEQAGPQLHEGLDVDLDVEQRQDDARVELAADVPVVDDVAAVPTRRELALVGVAGPDGEGAEVDVCGQGVGDEDVGGEELEVVAVDERPHGEVRAHHPRAGSADGQDRGRRNEGCTVSAAPHFRQSFLT